MRKLEESSAVSSGSSLCDSNFRSGFCLEAGQSFITCSWVYIRAVYSFHTFHMSFQTFRLSFHIHTRPPAPGSSPENLLGGSVHRFISSLTIVAPILSCQPGKILYLACISRCKGQTLAQLEASKLASFCEAALDISGLANKLGQASTCL